MARASAFSGPPPPLEHPMTDRKERAMEFSEFWFGFWIGVLVVVLAMALDGALGWLGWLG